MMTVKDVSRITGVSVRTLQYYDKIGLLTPAAYSDAGYRLYDRTVLEKMQQIMLYRELEFSLSDIKQIMNSPSFDRAEALRQQTELLETKLERLKKLVDHAHEMKIEGGKIMDFTAFDKSKQNEYEKRAKEKWGDTAAFAEYEHKKAQRSDESADRLNGELMEIFAEFGSMRNELPDSEPVQMQVKKLQDFITANYYVCTNEILASLGIMYSSDDEFRENIDRAGGSGTAVFASKAIDFYCKPN